MAQANHASTPRRRAVQPAAPPPNGSISQTGHGIATLAQDLADLQALTIALSNAEGPAERAREKQINGSLENFEPEEHTRCCHACLDLEGAGRRGHGMITALEQMILVMEPTTPSETLSLALILAEELHSFLAVHVRGEGREAVERDRLGDALWAVIRGLVHGVGAASPLVDAYTGRGHLVPWDAERSNAAREAARYVAREEEAPT